MPPENGTMTAGDRITRLEDQREDHLTECEQNRALIWTEISDMKVEMARQATRVALIVGALAVAGEIGVQMIFRAGP